MALLLQLVLPCCCPDAHVGLLSMPLPACWRSCRCWTAIVHHAGEDYPCGGRLLLFEVVKSSSGDAGAAQWSGRLIYTRCA